MFVKKAEDIIPYTIVMSVITLINLASFVKDQARSQILLGSCKRYDEKR